MAICFGLLVISVAITDYFKSKVLIEEEKIKQKRLQKECDDKVKVVFGDKTENKI